MSNLKLAGLFLLLTILAVVGIVVSAALNSPRPVCASLIVAVLVCSAVSFDSAMKHVMDKTEEELSSNEG